MINPRIQAESLNVLAKARDPAGVKATTRPSARRAHRCSIIQSSSLAPNAPPEMAAAFAPIQTPSADWPPSSRKTVNVDAEFDEKRSTCGRDLWIGIVGQTAVADETVQQGYGALPSEMVVADPLGAHRFITRAGTNPDRPGALRQAHQPLQNLRDIGPGQAEVAVTSLPLRCEQTRRIKLRQ